MRKLLVAGCWLLAAWVGLMPGAVRAQTRAFMLNGATSAQVWPTDRGVVRTFADSSARTAAVPDFVGQLGYQTDTATHYKSTGTSAGNWTSSIKLDSLGFVNGTGFSISLSPPGTSANLTIGLPSESGTLLGESATQTITNKSFALGSNTLTGTSAELAAALTDETGNSGGFVRAGSPALTTPNLGTPSAIVLTNGTGLPVATGISGLGTNVGTKLQRSNLGSGVVMKTSDQTRVTTTSPAADSALLFPLAASTNYRFRFWIMVMVESATPNIKCGLSGPASPTDVNWSLRIWSNTLISSTLGAWNGYSTGHGTAGGLTDNTARYIFEIEGEVRNGSNAGNLSFDWSQWNSSADDLTVKAGSHVAWEVAD